ncbi:hypothetical protein Tco_0732376, partial [Tanacetum coccineum]
MSPGKTSSPVLLFLVVTIIELYRFSYVKDDVDFEVSLENFSGC